MKGLQLVASALGLLGFAACTDGLDIPRSPTRLVYDASAGELPTPNDVLFADNSSMANLDATLNLPPSSDAGQQVVIDALNSLDGWSTTAPVAFRFSRGVDPATVVGGDTVRFFRVDAFADPVTGLKIGTPVSDVLAELTPGLDYELVAASSDSSIASWTIVPLRPLQPRSIYMYVITNGVMDADGFPVKAGRTYSVAKSTTILPVDHPAFGLQLLVSAMEFLASSDPDVVPPIPREEVVAAASFTTQSTIDVLEAARLISQGQESTLLAAICAGAPAPGHLACSAAPANTEPAASAVTLLFDTSTVGGSGDADLYQGMLEVPYYSSAAPNPAGVPVQSTAPLTGRWQARFSFLEGVTGADPMETDRHVTQHNPLPLQSAAERIPLLISLPSVASTQVQPATGWPVVIFQHGVTRQRTDLLALADRLGRAGFAAVAIDMPLHGVTDTGSLFHVGVMEGQLRERSFGLDLLTESGGIVTDVVPDGTADSSGAHFINFSSLQTQRDNLRQAVADLFAVVRVIQDNLNVDGSAVNAEDDFDPAQIHFVGQSLGGIVGATFAAVDADSASPALVSATFSVTGGGIPPLLVASPSFGPTVVAGLATAGLDQGTAGFEAFVSAAQALTDSADPVNFADGLNGGALPILLHEVVGGGPGGGLTDQVIPNDVPGAPLSGTDPLVDLLGLSQVTATTATSAAVVRFSEGVHSSLLDPDPAGDGDAENLAAFQEMQEQVALWLTSIATSPTVTISDASVIVP